MRYPTKNNRITSQYGYRMINGALDFHGGTDYGAEVRGVVGDPIYSIADDAKVVYVGFDSSRGHNIVLEHHTHCTRYNHLKSILVAEGDIVHETTVIGLMGTSGSSTGAHLHFEVHECKYAQFNQRWPNGEAKHTIDPELFFLKYMEKKPASCETEQLIADLEAVIDSYK